MSFGGSNPPWQRNSIGNAGGQQIPTLQSQMGLTNPNLVGFQNNQSIYNSNIAMASHQQSGGGGGGGGGGGSNTGGGGNSGNISMIPPLVGSNIATNPMFNQAVTYPTRGSGGGGSNSGGGLNPNAFGTHPNQQQQHGGGNQGQQSGGGSGSVQQLTKRVGIVTKIQNDFGFIDEEIFFQKNCCKGNYPKLGDRVYVEAMYSTNAAFKWNATLVQLYGGGSGGGGGGGGSGSSSSAGNMQQNITSSRGHQQQQQGQHHQQQLSQHIGGRSGIIGRDNGQGGRSGSGYNAVPPPNAYTGGFDRSGQPRQARNLISPLSSARRSSPLYHSHSRNHDSSRGGDDDDRKRRRDDRDRDRDRSGRDKRGDHSPDRRGVADKHSPDRKSSPKRRAASNVTPRYRVQIPKVPLNMVKADVLELKRRYTNLYIPSDFFFTDILWSESFPPNATFSIQKPCAFHIMHRSVEPPTENTDVLDPPDVDYLFSAKVMLMGIPPMSEMYRKCFSTAEEKEKEREGERSYVHPTRLINFLVGIRGKNEAMAIGGPWSPSLDGANPERDPSVLIRTAIRTCKSLTGIDLTPCTQWYRFVELYYRRAESVRKGRIIPARVETVVIYLPDVRSCVPTRLEWDDLHLSYKDKLESVIKKSETSMVEDNGEEKPDGGGNVDSGAKNEVTSKTLSSLSSSAAAAGSSEVSKGGVADSEGENAEVGGGGGTKEETGGNQQGTTGAASITTSGTSTTTTTASAAVSMAAADSDGFDAANEKDDTGNGNGKNEPTHYSDLDPKTMKVCDLRDELVARNLSPKGLKPQLIARLQKVLKTEENEENEENQDDDGEEGGGGGEEEVDDDGTTEDQVDNSAKTKARRNQKDDEAPQSSVAGDVLDMSDIVVIDEYDSTIPQDRKKLKEEPKPMDERERRLLEKRYQLPESPHLIVHPSTTAKSGRFFCNIMSLSILLDYRPEDTKEHSFEVSLFAELFNEMLMRDFGYNIYKVLHTLPEKVAKESGDKDEAKENSSVTGGENADDEPKEKKQKKDDEKLNNAMEVDNKSEDDSSSATNAAVPSSATAITTDKDRDSAEKDDKENKKSIVAVTSSSSASRDKDREREREKDRKRRRGGGGGGGDDDIDDDTYSQKSIDRRKEKEKEKDKDKDRPKYSTVDPDLLLSFVYFDQSHCGYISGKHVEELFFTLGLHLSRAQIRKLVTKAVSRDFLVYRKLTDRVREEKPIESVESITEIGGDSNITQKLSHIDELSLGNKIYLPVFKKDTTSAANSNDMGNKDDTAENGDVVETLTGMVSYKGGFIDIEKLLDQMKRSEKARDDTEQLLVDLRKTNSDLLASNLRAKDRIKDLQSDVKSYSRKLSDTEQSLSSTNKKASEYHSILSSVYDRVSTVFAKAERKNESSRDKDKDRNIGDKKDKDHRSGSANERNLSSTAITIPPLALDDKDKEDTKEVIVKKEEK